MPRTNTRTRSLACVCVCASVRGVYLRGVCLCMCVSMYVCCVYMRVYACSGSYRPRALSRSAVAFGVNQIIIVGQVGGRAEMGGLVLAGGRGEKGDKLRLVSILLLRLRRLLILLRVTTTSTDTTTPTTTTSTYVFFKNTTSTLLCFASTATVLEL